MNGEKIIRAKDDMQNESRNLMELYRAFDEYADAKIVESTAGCEYQQNVNYLSPDIIARNNNKVFVRGASNDCIKEDAVQ